MTQHAHPAQQRDTTTPPSSVTQRQEAVSFVGIRRDGRDIDLEYHWIEGDPDSPLIVFLHEGLGSISLWRGWPRAVCNALGCRGLVYSRYGYGQSTPRLPGEPRNIDYLHHEARHDLPAVLDALGLQNERPVLFGHSDGGSIALLCAAMMPQRIRAIAVAAPHIFVEDITVQGIRDSRTIVDTTDFMKRLQRHHKDAESVFWSWYDTWLTPEFRDWNIESHVADIACPILAIQGEDDEYGTLEQIRGIQRLAGQTRLCIIAQCGHSPHRDQPDAVTGALRDFLAGV